MVEGTVDIPLWKGGVQMRLAKVAGEETLQASRAIEAYKYAKQEERLASAPWKEVQAQAKEVLLWAMQSLNSDSIETEAGRAYMRTGHTRVTYDAKALDALCASSPELASILTPHRKEKEYPPTLTVR
jgi:hypothetical protein